MSQPSDLSFIDVKDTSDPSFLFQQWVQEAKSCGAPVWIMNLATANKKSQVSNRNIVITEIMSDSSLAFSTQINSNKVKDITENPNVCASIMLNYTRDGTKITKQINLAGKAERLPQEKCETYFEKLNLPAKIRSWIAKDCKSVEWTDLKKRHDELLKEVLEKGKHLEMPNTLVAYQIVPHKIDFYFNEYNKIGDRVLFIKNDNGTWTFERIMP